MDLLQKISVISFVTLGRSSTNLWKPQQRQRRKKKKQKIPQCNGLVTGPGPLGTPTLSLALPHSSMQSVLELLKVLLTCNAHWCDLLYLCDVRERNALQECNARVDKVSDGVCLPLPPCPALLFSLHLCCKFNKLSEKEIETMRMCLLLSRCPSLSLSLFRCVFVQVNWSIKDCRNSFASQASHLHALSCEMGVDSATKCCKHRQ